MTHVPADLFSQSRAQKPPEDLEEFLRRGQDRLRSSYSEPETWGQMVLRWVRKIWRML